MDQLLRTHDWEAFARRYNGRNFAAHHYDVLLNHFYQRFTTGQLPDLNVRTAQIFLTYKGFPLEEIDGTTVYWGHISTCMGNSISRTSGWSIRWV